MSKFFFFSICLCFCLNQNTFKKMELGNLGKRNLGTYSLSVTLMPKPNTVTIQKPSRFFPRKPNGVTELCARNLIKPSLLINLGIWNLWETLSWMLMVSLEWGSKYIWYLNAKIVSDCQMVQYWNGFWVLDF